MTDGRNRISARQNNTLSNNMKINADIEEKWGKGDKLQNTYNRHSSFSQGWGWFCDISKSQTSQNLHSLGYILREVKRGHLFQKHAVVNWDVKRYG